MIYSAADIRSISCDQPKTDLKAIYFQGTFDPVHKGHISALEAAIDALKPDFSVVVTDDEENNRKPNRKSWSVRLKMVQKAFQNCGKIYISAMPRDRLRMELLKIAKVYTLIGSDVLSFYKTKKDILFDGICVCLRASEDGAEKESIQGKEVVYVTPKIQNISSTKIRKTLADNPSVYEMEDNENTLIEGLPAKVARFIVKNKIYSPFKVQPADAIMQRIHSFITKRYGEPASLVDLTATGEGGLSGDLTLIAATEKEKIFIKIFVKATHKTDFQHELNGNKLLNQMSLKHSQAPTITWAKSKRDFSHIGMPFIPLMDMRKQYQLLSIGELEESKFIESCFTAGRAMSELHASSSSEIRPAKIDKEITKHVLRFEECLPKISKKSPDDAKQLADLFYKAIGQFKRNPGVHTYVHGDANPANFFVDGNGNVKLIDLGRLSLYRDKQEKPSGFPGEDLNRFLYSLDWLKSRLPMAEEIIYRAQKAFIDGYGEFATKITPEAQAFYSTYWFIRTLAI